MESIPFDPYASSVNPNTANKKSIRRSFRSRTASWNPFRVARHQEKSTSDSCYRYSLKDRAPSDSLSVAPREAASMIIDLKAEENFRVLRAVSAETVLTTMDFVDLSVAPTEIRSNLTKKLKNEVVSLSSAISHSDESDELEEEADENILSLVFIEVVSNSSDFDGMSDVSDASRDDFPMDDEGTLATWLLHLSKYRVLCPVPMPRAEI